MPRWAALAGPFALALVIALTGTARRGDAGSVAFGRGELNFSISNPTSLAWGPDGRLYVASQSSIVALTLDPATKQVLSTENVASSQTGILGIAFDPTASPITLYASRQNLNATGGYQGVVSKFTAPSWTRQDVITGLPSSAPASNHFTNGLAFDGLGRLSIAQGSNTDAGVESGSAWPETPLSAAILIADVHALGFNGAITYSPAGSPADNNVNKTGGDVSVFASGTRNPYDLVVHTNGYVYATDNGPSGPTTSASCSTSGTNASASDELNLIEAGNYYGHPNRNRGRFDAGECVYRPAEEVSGGGYTGPIAILPQHCSCDGLAEYTSYAFAGAMQGDLLIAEWGIGRVRRVQLSPDGRSVASPITTLASGFANPLDLAVGPDGTIYVAEYGGNKVSFLEPPGQDSDSDGCADAQEEQTAPGSQATGGLRDPNYFWDFFDTPDNGNVRDRAVSVADIGREVARFGSSGSTAIDPLSAPPAAPAYHTAFDRSAALPGSDPWDLGPPDGGITVGDIGSVVVQFGHSCA